MRVCPRANSDLMPLFPVCTKAINYYEAARRLADRTLCAAIWLNCS